MDEFEHRERGAENAFAYDEAQSFRVRIAALRKLARWAAETGKREAPDADADAAVARALAGVDDETIIADLARDLQGAGMSDHRVRARLANFVQEAAREIHDSARESHG
jgi:hypothetical protein